MKRRNFLLGASAIGAITAFAIKPGDMGVSYSDYFRRLNHALKQQGPFKPVMIIDLEKLDQNIKTLMSNINSNVNYRIVAKSLPSPELLEYIMRATNSHRLMLFHLPFIQQVTRKFQRSDILLGKPMPVGAAQKFYREHSSDNLFEPAKQLQWLIDTPARLIQYQQLAHRLGVKMRINFEIDVGLHRGGLTTQQQLKDVLEIVFADPEHLEFSGLMGYDAHVVKIPSVLKNTQQAFIDSQLIYKNLIALIKSDYPEISIDKLCLNGAGSPTISLHQSSSVINDISAGSCLVKPTDFDIPSLEGFIPAAYIATPVLKKMPGISLPSAENLSGLLQWWDPNKAQSFFIYGGKWMAKYESPKGLQGTSLYGLSTNQDLVNSSVNVDLQVDDHVFLRPTQSEAVFLQFGDILVTRNGRITDRWPILRDV